MSKYKNREDRKRKDLSVPDTGQGPAGNLGSDGDLGGEGVFVTNKKTKKGTHNNSTADKQKPGKRS